MDEEFVLDWPNEGLANVSRLLGLVLGYDDVASDALVDMESGRIYTQQKED